MWTFCRPALFADLFPQLSVVCWFYLAIFNYAYMPCINCKDDLMEQPTLELMKHAPAVSPEAWRLRASTLELGA